MRAPLVDALRLEREVHARIEQLERQHQPIRIIDPALVGLCRGGGPVGVGDRRPIDGARGRARVQIDDHIPRMAVVRPPHAIATRAQIPRVRGDERALPVALDDEGEAQLRDLREPRESRALGDTARERTRRGVGRDGPGGSARRRRRDGRIRGATSEEARGERERERAGSEERRVEGHGGEARSTRGRAQAYSAS